MSSFGTTSLVEIGNQYALEIGGSGPILKYGGTPIVEGQISPWSLVGAEQTAGGYEVAWQLGNGFAIWTTDSNGNFVSNSGAIAGNSAALESFETSFHQDLNGDGTIGFPVIESFGTTSLVEIGNQYALEIGGSGPILKYGGTPIVEGQISPWSLVGAEQTAGGYEVAWQLGNGFAIWTTDSNGNFVSNSGAMAGNSAALESFETSFHQDLNGDGVIGVPPSGSAPVVISDVTTDLVDNTVVVANRTLQDQPQHLVSKHNDDMGNCEGLVVEGGRKDVSMDFADWHLAIEASPADPSATQLNNVDFRSIEPAHIPSPAQQSLLLSVGGSDNDTFVFKSVMVNGVAWNTMSSYAIELDQFSNTANTNQVSSNPSQAQQPEPVLEAASGRHHAVTGLDDPFHQADVPIVGHHASNVLEAHLFGHDGYNFLI